MKRCLLCFLAVAASAQDLPVKEPGEIIEGLPNLGAIDTSRLPPPPAPALTVEQAAARLESARRKQTRWEKLARQGVLSRAEAESTQPEVGEALVRYERAHVAQLQADWAALQARHAEPALVDSAAGAMAAGQALLANAEAQWLQTRLRLAQVNLDRMRRLAAEKLVGRAMVERAQSTLAALQTQAAGRPASLPH